MQAFKKSILGTSLLLFNLGIILAHDHGLPHHHTKDKNKHIDLRLEVLKPQTIVSNKKETLKFAFINKKTGNRYTDLKAVHTEKFHLLIVHKEMGWYGHEHPQLKKDGTWDVSMRFPGGGTYYLYADIAPKGYNTQTLIKKIQVKGKPLSTQAKAKRHNSRYAFAGNMVSWIMFNPDPPEAGKDTMLTFKVQNKKTRKPVRDIEEYLAAGGHLVMISTDKKTFVHTHPNGHHEHDHKDESNCKGMHMKHHKKPVAPNGIIKFHAVFPKAGDYHGYAQFKRRGKVYTFPFKFKVVLDD